MDLLELHKHPQFTKQCCEILNSEWKRSVTARMHSLEKSCDNFPTSLVLVNNDNEKEVIGHSRLGLVTCDPEGCWIESVVIKQESRGKGLGKLLMKKTEDHARRLGYKTAYLSTRDKQGFYEHIGYTYCDPVCSANGTFPIHLLSKVDKRFINYTQQSKLRNNTANGKLHTLTPGKNVPSPPPIPPPLPVKVQQDGFNNNSYWMKKAL